MVNCNFFYLPVDLFNSGSSNLSCDLISIDQRSAVIYFSLLSFFTYG